MPDKVKSSNIETQSYGSPHKHDPNFGGLVHKRSCTDVLCLIIFVAFLVGWIVLAIVASLNGNPERLLYPTDSKGRICGFDEDVQDKPFLLFFDFTRCASPKVPFTGCPTPQVCVRECPVENWSFLINGTDKSKLICKEGTDMNKDINSLVKNDDCAPYYVSSQSIAHRCIPRALGNFGSKILDIILWKSSDLSQAEKLNVVSDGLKYVMRFVQVQEVAEGVYEDVKQLWPYILGGCVVAMLISFLWILLLQLIAKIMVWLSLLLFTGLCGFVAYYTFYKYQTVRSDLESSNMTSVEREITQALSKVADVETTWLVIFIITVCIFVTCLLIVIFLRKRITLAIALINEASKAVRNMTSSLFFPLIPYLLHIVFLMMFMIVGFLITSAGTPSHRIVCKGNCACSPLKENATCNPLNFTAPECKRNEATCQFHLYDKHPVLSKLQIYNVIGLFWTTCFVSAFCEMVLAGAFVLWYWNKNKTKDSMPSMPILKSLGRTFRYHLGSLAFGSLIIAIVRMIRVIFEYIDYKLKKHADYKIVKVLSCLCRCCLWCLEKFLRFVNRNAYIYCAIYGTNFCTSARKSFSLIMRNIARVFVLDKVTDFLLLIGKLVVTSSMAVLSYFFFSGEIPGVKGHLPPVNYYLTPVVLISLATFLIASSFFDVYSMAVDTLFICFLEDSERNDGSAERPYLMTKDLQRILGKKNRVEPEE